MDFQYKFDELKRKLQEIKCKSEELDKEIIKTEKNYAECLAFTDAFLKCCSKHKIKAVCIMTRNEIVKTSMDFPFDESRSVFANGTSTDGFPAIWSVVEEMGIEGGCGNDNQHQINYQAQAKLINGVYQYKDGKWNRIGD